VRKANAAAKNDVESYIINTRDSLSSEESFQVQTILLLLLLLLLLLYINWLIKEAKINLFLSIIRRSSRTSSTRATPSPARSRSRCKQTIPLLLLLLLLPFLLRPLLLFQKKLVFEY